MGELARHGLYKTFITDINNQEVDVSYNSLAVIPKEHTEIHKGKFFSYINYARGLALSATINVGIKTGDNEAHLVYCVNTIFDTNIRLYKQPTISTFNTITVINHNDTLNIVNTVQIGSNTTISSLGSLWFDVQAGYNGLPSTLPMASKVDRTNEYVLKANSSYLFQIINNGASNTISYCLEWYE